MLSIVLSLLVTSTLMLFDISKTTCWILAISFPNVPYAQIGIGKTFIFFHQDDVGDQTMWLHIVALSNVVSSVLCNHFVMLKTHVSV